MEKISPKIEAIVWCRKSLNFNKWEIKNRNESKELKLSGNLSEKEIGSIIQTICGQIAFDKGLSLDDLFKNVTLTQLEDFAFIKLIGENGVKTNNGCCSDFKDWKQLKNIKTESIWFGHDPTPVFEYDKSKEEVLVWIDDERVGSNKDEYSILFSWREFKESLKKLESDLNDFLVLTKIWMESNSPKFADEFVEKVKENLGV